MNRFFSYLVLILVGSVGVGCASALWPDYREEPGGVPPAGYALTTPAPLNKGSRSCMDWLRDLETQREEIGRRLYFLETEGQYDPAEDPDRYEAKKNAEISNLTLRLQILTKEISETIGGKYGISSTSATEEEREEILRAIARTRQISTSTANALSDLYLGYDTSTGGLETRLASAVKRSEGVSPDVIAGHLAAVAFADGVAFLENSDLSRRRYCMCQVIR